MTLLASSILWYALAVPLGLILTTVLLLIPIATLILAIVTTIRQRLLACSAKPLSLSSYQTAIYRGRVSHTRYRPTTHSFSYPLFFCVLDLNEVDDLFGSANCGGSDKGSRSRAALWPLSLLMQFRESDHLKNGEGLILVDGNGGKKVADEAAAADNTIRARICRLVAERTKGKCRPTQNQRIFLVTHLCYYFYCFNPVSFYYILKEGSGDIDAIVAEVSNTPWNEMQCYVLHPDSVDIDVVKAGRPRTVTGEDKSVSKFPRADEDDVDADDGADSDISNKWESINYIFQKAFHVSPFMTMDHKYDWTFWEPRSDRIAVSTSMIREGVPYFNAYFDIRRQPFTPMRLCYQLIRLPFYCVIIQIWIHVEAFWLFMKGVEFIPHPKGSETASSKLIAQIMAPFFLAKDWICSGREKSE